MAETESATGSSSFETALREAVSTSFVAQPAEFRSDRFELVRELGRGAFGIVYEAIDHDSSGAVVALKLLRGAHAERLYRFKREFRSLAEVRHDNLVPLYELIAAGPNVFFTMQRIDGRSPIDHVSGRPEEARDLLRQLVHGLGALHAAGKLHCDIKPSNILVEESGRVVLLDFGLATDLDPANRIDTTRAGTPLYMSPEQCAEQPLDTASDWYAVGTLLFEALTGRTPFEDAVDDIFEIKQSTTAPRARSIAPDVPPDLDDLCAALLARDPSERPSGDEILRRLDTPSSSAPPLHVRREPFVGREPEKAILHRQFEESLAGRRSVAFVSGPSGIGKSALVRSFVDELRDRHPETRVLVGRCFELELVPYKALDTVVDELAQQLRHEPAVDLLPDDAGALATLFPVLRRTADVAKVATATSAMDLRTRAIAALRDLFTRLRERGPIVVCVDDLQWGDLDSAALLSELIRSADAPPICWVMAYREEDAATSPLLARLAQLRASTLADVPIHDLRLAGLDASLAEDLAATLLGSTPGHARTIAVDSRGNPFFVRELARAGEGHHALEGLVVRRIGELRAAARKVLDVVAVAGQPLELEVVAACTEARGDLRDALASLRAEHLVRARDGHHEKLIECYHDRIREAVVGNIEPAARAGVHLALANALEGRRASDAAQIGRHFAAGGDAGKAQLYLARAAGQAAAALAFEEAIELFRRALDQPTGADTRSIELAYANALSAAGHGQEAARVWLSLVERVGGTQGIDLRRRATEDLLLAGQVERGFASMNALLGELALSVPRGPAAALATIARNRALQAWSGLELRPRRNAASERELLRVDTVASLAWPVLQLDPLLGYALQTQHVQLALRSGDRQRATVALALEALVAALRGSSGSRQALSILEAARAMARGVDEAELPERTFRTVEAVLALFEGRWRDSLRALDDAERAPALGTIGHGSVRGTMYSFRAMNLFWMGRSGELLRHLPAQLHDMEHHDHLYGWLWLKLLESWALSCTGDLTAARATSDLVAARLPPGIFQVHRWYLEFGRVKFLLLEGNAEAAWRAVEALRRRMRFTMLKQVQRVSGWYVRANVVLARAAENRKVRRAMLREARRLVARIEGERLPWAAAIAMTIRASLAQVAGERAEALRLLVEAEPLLEAADLEAILAVVRLELGRRLGGAAGETARRRAESWLERERVVPAVSRVLLAGASEP